MAEKTFGAREIIFKEDEMADVAYVIRKGSVEILKRGDSGEIKLADLKEGEIFGEMGLFDPKSPRSATARTTSETVVDVISEQELRELLDQCPKRVLPIIISVFERLRQTNQRVKSREQATALLESDFSKIVVEPAGEFPGSTFTPVEMPIAHLPFRIGGYPMDGEVKRSAGNHVNIACQGPPLLVSYSHCEVAIQEGKIYVRDMGSRFGTIVNDLPIGRGRGEYKAPIKKGENLIILGDKKTSPYKIRITCT